MTALAQSYILPTFSGILRHSNHKSTVVRDGTEVYKELDAQAISGDYFVMLASQIDMLNRNSDDYETKLALENIVSDLIYLQDHYRITKNKQTEN